MNDDKPGGHNAPERDTVDERTDAEEPSAVRRAGASPDANSVAYLVTCLEAAVVALRPVAIRYDSATDDERRELAVELEPVCREFGNIGHRLSRTMRELLLGVDEP